MRERPILFSTPMVRAILEGKKTQTRRVVKPQPYKSTPGFTHWKEGDDGIWGGESGVLAEMAYRSPYGKPGDGLWVREAFRYRSDNERVAYRADRENPGDREPAVVRWRPSIHMPHWASRITLTITEVRVEPVQEIAAGESDGICGRKYKTNDAWEEGIRCPNPVAGFMLLWDKLNAGRGYGWEANPWVWVITFKAVKPS